MRLKHDAVIPFLIVLVIGAMAPSVTAQSLCDTEYDMARGVLRAAALPEGLSRKIETKLINAHRKADAVKSNAVGQALQQLDVAMQLLGGNDTKAVPPDLLAAVNGAINGYRACLTSAPPVRSAAIRVTVSRYTSSGATELLEGATVRINGEVAGFTAKDGTITLTVAADRLLHIGAGDGDSFSGAADVTAAPATTQPVTIAMTENAAAEPNALALDEIRADGLLPFDFSTLTLRFVDDDKTVAVKTLGSVLLESERGFATALDSMFAVNARGEIVVTKPELVRQALLGYAGTLSLTASAYDADGRFFESSVRFEMGRFRLAGRLIAPPSTSTLDTGNVFITLTDVVGHVYRGVSDAQGGFNFPYVPSALLSFEADRIVSGVQYRAYDDLYVDRDLLDVLLPMYRNGETLNYGALASAGVNLTASSLFAPFADDFQAHAIHTNDITYTISDTTAGKCAIGGSAVPACQRVAVVGPSFDIPQGTQNVTLRYQVTTEETVARATAPGGGNRDSYALGVRDQKTGNFPFPTPSGDTTHLWQAGDLPLPGTSKWIEIPMDVSPYTGNGPWTVHLEANIYNCCVGDNTLQSQITVELVITNQCPIATGVAGVTAQAGNCPPTLSISGLTADSAPVTGYRNGLTTNDGHVYSIPRPGRFNYYARHFSAIVKKSPDTATLSADVSLYNATSDEMLTTVRVLSPLVPIPGTNLYYMPMTFDAPIVSSRVNSTPPPAHFIRYRFHFHAEDNGQATDKIVVSDPSPVIERALWRMPDIFNDRRFGGGHLNGGDGVELGGDSWASRGAYQWMEHNEILLTRINDISGEHGVQIGHSGHDYGTDIDIYHFWPTPTSADPIGSDVYNLLKADAQTAQDVNSSDPTRRAKAAAAIGRLGQWVRASRDGIDNLLALPEVAHVYYLTDGGEWAPTSKHRAVSHGGTAPPPPPPTGILPGWGGDLLRSGRIVYGNGVVADTGQGTWANGSNAKMLYLAGHHDHVHVGLDRCIVDRDTCPAGVNTLSCRHVAVTSQPQSATISAGQSATLSVGVIGDGPIYYQWYAAHLDSNDETAVPNSNSPTITVSPSASTIYRVDVVNNCGDDQSAPAVVTVGAHCTPPAVTSSPASGSITRGQAVALTVIASGTAPLSYQWYFGFAPDTTHPVSSGGGNPLNVSPTTTTTYWARVTNGCGSADSASATIVVLAPCVSVSITTPPASTAIVAGDSATLSVTAGGTAPVHFQWFIGTAGDTSQPVPLSDRSAITVTPSVSTDYWVRASNGCGVANSATAHVTVSTSCTPPSIIAQPAGVVVDAGQPATLSLAAAGSAPLNVTWYTSADAVGSGSSISVSPSATTSYYAVVTNGCGSVRSVDVTITVNCAAPVITAQPANTTITAGDSATLSLAASGAQPLTVSWFTSDGALLDTGTSVTVSPASTTTYFATVSNICGSVRSQNATVFVNPCDAPAVVTNPQPATVTAGDPVTLTALGSGTSLLYTWYDQFDALLGHGASITFTPAVTRSYYCVISNSCGSVRTSLAQVTVNPACNAPQITGDPISKTINAGQSVTLAVFASGVNVTFQWFLADGTPISGALTTNNFIVSPATTTSYYAVATNECGSARSATATVTVIQP